MLRSAHTLSYVSLFSSAGLGCFGFSQEGFACVATAELLGKRLAVQQANRLGWRDGAYVLGDLTSAGVRQHLMDEIAAWRAAHRDSDVTVVIATPPCQGMSVANHKKKDELPRNSLVLESLRVIREVKPRYFVLENVAAFLRAACISDDGQLRSIGDAIDDELGGLYNIASMVGNLKDFGSPSSRTRTLVVGVRCDIPDAPPAAFMPEAAAAPSLRELIGDLPALERMGETAPGDILHRFRKYDPRMRPWIRATPEGKSAFQNEAPEFRPHRLIDGRRVENVAKNGDKYRRVPWDRPAPCVHTRNDIFASQNTVHPKDDRVFSIRELMRMMGVPSEFRWVPFDEATLQSLSEEDVEAFYKEHELNIRQCLGEGVPTPVFASIARKIAAREQVLDLAVIDPTGAWAEVEAIERQNEHRKRDAAFFTRRDVALRVARAAIRNLPQARRLRVLEPSAGAGSMVLALLDAAPDVQFEFTLVEKNPDVAARLSDLMSSVAQQRPFEYRILVGDFLTMPVQENFDLVIGNPPFGSGGGSRAEPDLSEKFFTHCFNRASAGVLIVPKSVATAPRYAALRNALAEVAVPEVHDLGESAFVDVGIETVALVWRPGEAPGGTRVVSTVTGQVRTLAQSYIMDPRFPNWLLYRSAEFDTIANRLQLGVFRPRRDRSFTRRQAVQSGTVPVVGGRDVPRDPSAPLRPYGFLPESHPGVRPRFSGASLVVPNLSYYPRARVLPSGWFADGSAAVLDADLAHADLERSAVYFGTEEFYWFYRVARNYSTRTLNVDAAAAFYWGVPGRDVRVEALAPSRATSRDLFSASPRADGTA